MMLLKGRYSLVSDLIAVACEGCGNVWLGNTGKDGDPVMDATYREDTNTFICSHCYTSPTTKGMN